jgi:hypothetical protein
MALSIPLFRLRSTSARQARFTPRAGAFSFLRWPAFAHHRGINMNKYVTTRRRFLKQTSIGLGLAGLAMTEMSCRILSRDASGVSIVTFDNDAIASPRKIWG